MDYKIEKEIIHYLKELSDIPENIKAKDIYEKYIKEHTEIYGIFIRNVDIVKWYIGMRTEPVREGGGRPQKIENIMDLRRKYIGISLVDSKCVMDEIETGRFCEEVKRWYDVI